MATHSLDDYGCHLMICEQVWGWQVIDGMDDRDVKNHRCAIKDMTQPILWSGPFYIFVLRDTTFVWFCLVAFMKYVLFVLEIWSGFLRRKCLFPRTAGRSTQWACMSDCERYPTAIQSPNQDLAWLDQLHKYSQMEQGLVDWIVEGCPTNCKELAQASIRII